jgi:hypothetical protein
MDIQNLTLGEITQVENLSGRAFVELSDEEAPKGALLTALAFVMKKRDNPNYSFEDAQKLTMADIEEIIGSDSPEKKE